MRRYTTPTLTVQIQGADLTGCDIWLTFRQGRKEVTVRDFESVEIGEDATTLAVPLSQIQTARFAVGEEVHVQANVMDQNGYRAATDLATTTFGTQLLEVVKHYGE